MGKALGVKRDHVRQLRQWADDVAAHEDLNVKGLLIANAFSAAEPPRVGS